MYLPATVSPMLLATLATSSTILRSMLIREPEPYLSMLIVVVERYCTGQAIFHSPNEGDAASNKQNWMNVGFTDTDLAIIMKEEYDHKSPFPKSLLRLTPLLLPQCSSSDCRSRRGRRFRPVGFYHFQHELVDDKTVLSGIYASGLSPQNFSRAEVWFLHRTRSPYWLLTLTPCSTKRVMPGARRTIHRLPGEQPNVEVWQLLNRT